MQLKIITATNGLIYLYGEHKSHNTNYGVDEIFNPQTEIFLNAFAKIYYDDGTYAPYQTILQYKPNALLRIDSYYYNFYNNLPTYMDIKIFNYKYSFNKI